MRVNKVAGNFHMAMGDSMVKDGRHVHIFNIDDSDTFNIRYHNTTDITVRSRCYLA